jgi:hypothetical protein
VKGVAAVSPALQDHQLAHADVPPGDAGDDAPVRDQHEWRASLVRFDPLPDLGQPALPLVGVPGRPLEGLPRLRLPEG